MPVARDHHKSSIGRVAACCVALACPTAATMAQSGDVSSANYVLPFCKRYLNKEGPSGAFTQGYCAGLVVGMAFVAGNVGKPWCVAMPDKVTEGQAVRVVVRYIEARP